MPVTIEFGEYAVDQERGILTRRGYTVPLQDQPFRLLVLLLSRPGAVVSREEIQAHLWPANTNVEFDQSLRVAVSKLREALRDSATGPIYVETIPRRGYRFIASVRTVTTEPPSGLRPQASGGPMAAAQEIPPPATSQALTPHRLIPRMPAWFAVLAAGAAVLAVVTFSLFRGSPHTSGGQPVDAHPVLRKSIAVLGLRNLNGVAQDQWLSTALSEMLSTELSVSDRIRVISGEEVARAGLSAPPTTSPSHQTLTQYANSLGANVIVYGSYLVSRDPAGKLAPRLRLDLRVEDLSSDAPPMALVEEGSAADLFTLVASSGTGMRQRFGLGEASSESSAAVRRTLPRDPVAAQFYAEGLSRLRSFDAAGARDLLLKAAKLEPTHAGTHLALADAWHAIGLEDQARAEAARAVELGADLPRPELLEMQGQLAMLSNDWPKAREIFRSLYTFYPDSAEYGLRLARAQYLGDNPADGLATLASLHKLGLARADEASIDNSEANANLQTGDSRQAATAADRALALGKALGLAEVQAEALWIKSRALDRQGNLPESLSAAEQAQALFHSVGDKRGEAVANMVAGDVLYDKAEFGEALKRFQSSLAIFQAIGHLRNTATCVERVGNTYYSEGALAESRKAYQQALALYRQIHWEAGMASAIGNLANVQDAEGDIPGSLASNQQGLALFQTSGDKRGTGDTLANMGALEMERGNLDAAQTDFDRAAEIATNIGYLRGIAWARIGHGDVLLARNDVAAAEHQYELAAKAVEGRDETEVSANVLFSRGAAAWATGNAEKAIPFLQQSRDSFVHSGNHGQAAMALAKLAEVQLDLGHLKEAAEAATKASREAQAQFAPEYQGMADLAVARAELAQKKSEDARKGLRSALKAAEAHGYLPLAMEMRIALAASAGMGEERRRQLAGLAQEADGLGWKLIAARARRENIHP